VSRTASAREGQNQVRLTEIFLSLQGESTTTGLPTVFVRLTGCPLRCAYCDTEYAFHGGRVACVGSVVEQVTGYGVRHVTVTGGEPLAQPGVHPLMAGLCDAGLAVSLETSGALDVSGVDTRVRKIVDIKTPDSGEVHRNRWANLDHCGADDELKFVLCSRDDYEWARLKCDQLGLYQCPFEILFSPAAPSLAARELADWIVADRIPVRMQMQLHKVLWGDEPGR
jgi:7-carboxy-7-deazaguanine synthase